MEEQKQSSESTSTEEDSDVSQVHVKLPTGETLSFQAKGSSNVRDLKMMVEVNSGVPSDLFTLVHTRGDNKAIELNDEIKMADIEALHAGGGTGEEDGDESMTFELSIPPWWQRFVDRCMKRDDRQILKRIFIKMNQISSEERAFVAAFIAAQKGDAELLQDLLNGDVKIDVKKTVQCSGRTLLHAAVAGGNFSCAAAIFMNGGSALLARADRQGVSPMDMARNTNQHDLVKLLNQYVKIQSQEASGIQSAIGKTPEADIKGLLKDESRANSQKHQANDTTIDQVEESKQNMIHQNESKEKPARTTVDDIMYKVRDELMREEVNQRKENKEELSEGPIPARAVPQRMLQRGSNPQLKLHMPLRACRSLNNHDRPSSAGSVRTCLEEIRPLDGKLPLVKQVEEKLPKVNTPTSSPMNSPRMGRKLVPSLLNPERPGSPILRPRSPLHPRPKSPMLPRSRSPTTPLMRTQAIRTYSSPAGSPEPRRRAMSLNVGESGNSRYVGYEKRKKPGRNFGSTLQLAGVADELNSGIVLYRDLVRLRHRLPTMDQTQTKSGKCAFKITREKKNFCFWIVKPPI